MARPSYRMDKGRYKFYNGNPRNLLSTSDCVIKGIALALGIEWEEAYKGLAKLGLELKDAATSDRVYQEYLKRLGFKKEKQPRKENGRKFTTEEFAETCNYGTYIINQSGHLTVVVDGYIYDTWNCSHKAVGNYWKVK